MWWYDFIRNTKRNEKYGGRLFIDEELISLQLPQIKDDNGIVRELNILITILITINIIRYHQWNNINWERWYYKYSC